MLEKVVKSAAKSASISFALGFVFVAGMLNKAIKETAEEFVKEEEEDER